MMRDFDSVFSLEFVCLDIECLVVLDAGGRREGGEGVGKKP